MKRPVAMTAVGPPEAPSGGLRFDGSWSEAGGNPATTEALKLVIRVRRTTSFAPDKVAAMIAGMPDLAGAFPVAVLEAWGDLHSPDDWPMATALNAAQEAVKREGLGAHDRRWWKSGHWSPPRDRSPEGSLPGREEPRNASQPGAGGFSGQGMGLEPEMVHRAVLWASSEVEHQPENGVSRSGPILSSVAAEHEDTA